MAGTRNLSDTTIDLIADQQQGQFALDLVSVPGITQRGRHGKALWQGGTRTVDGDILRAPPATFRTSNPPFTQYSATRGPVLPGHKKLTRGLIRKEATGTGTGLNAKLTLHFQFNPFSINFAYATDPQVAPAEMQPESMDGVNNIVGGASFSLQLLFDRSAEVARGTMPDGVLVDVDILDKIMGIDDGHAISSTPVTVRLGPRWKLTGWITNCDITYTHFSHRMTPMRCTANVGFVALYGSDNALGAQDNGNPNPGANIAPTSGSNTTDPPSSPVGTTTSGTATT